MATSADVLKAFLVSIGFKVDEAGYKKFKDQMDSLTKRVVVFGEEAAVAATAMSYSVKSMASDLEKLYFASQKTGSSVTALNTWGLAAQNAGVSAEVAQAAAENLAGAVRRNPGMGFMLRNIGVDTTKGAVEQLNQLVELLSKMGKPGTAGYAVATQYASMFGMDEQTFFMLRKNREEVKRTEQGYKEYLKAVGLTDAGIQKISEHGHDFMSQLRMFEAQLQILATVVEGRLLPLAEPVLKFLERAVGWLTKADKSTGGWSSGLLAVVSAFGAVKAAKGLLGMLGLGSGVAGGAAVAGEETTVAAAAGPAGWVVAIVAAVAAGLVWMQLHPAEVRAAVKGSWDWIKQEAGAAATGAGTAGSVLKQGYKTLGMGGTVTAIANGFSPVLGDVVGRLSDFISHKEGFRSKAYWDQDHYSIGYGTAAKSANETIDEPEAARRRDAVIKSTMDFVKSHLSIMLTGRQIGALTSLVYNVGEGNFSKSQLLRDLNAGNMDAAMRDWSTLDHAKSAPLGTHDAGLHARRQQEISEFSKDVHVHQEAHVTVSGVHDPHAAGKAAGTAVSNAFADLLRNTKGAFAG